MQSLDFLKWLYPKRDGMLTLTAIHPSGAYPTPSRHIPLSNPSALYHALDQLHRANQAGWGAYYAVGIRRSGLGRWRRGGIQDVVALPALYVDLDDPQADLHMPSGIPEPSCIVHSGGGYHLYWKLKAPTDDLKKAGDVLRALAHQLSGDRLSVAQSLRLPHTINTKPKRDTRCQIVTHNDLSYTLADFAWFVPLKRTYPLGLRAPPRINPDGIQTVTDHFRRMGYRKRGDWLNGRCIYPAHHKHEDCHPSFGFNTRTGYGYCYRCGTILLKEIVHELSIQPADSSGLFYLPERKIA